MYRQAKFNARRSPSRLGTVAHLDSDDRAPMPNVHNQKVFELHVFRFMNATRALLEGAPEWPPP